MPTPSPSEVFRMTLMLVLLVLLPWSIWRQMHEHEVTREGLFKLPLIFAAIGVFGFGTGAIPTDAAAHRLSRLQPGAQRRLRRLARRRDPDLAQRRRQPGQQGQPHDDRAVGRADRLEVRARHDRLDHRLVPGRARRRGVPLPRAVVRRPEPRRRPPHGPVGRRAARPGRGAGMRLRALLAGVAAIGAVALAAAPAQAAPLACPGTFSVLHDDTIGFVAVPKGSYQITTLDSSALSCASATAAFARFLQDFDGKLPSPWQLNALTGTFVRGNGPAAFEVAPVGDAGDAARGRLHRSHPTGRPLPAARSACCTTTASAGCGCRRAATGSRSARPSRSAARRAAARSRASSPARRAGCRAAGGSPRRPARSPATASSPSGSSPAGRAGR